MISELRIIQAKDSDISEIKFLMEKVFGKKDQLEKIFEKWISNPNYSVFVATVQDQVVGVSTWLLKTDLDYARYEVFGDQAIQFLKNKKTAWTVNLAIDSNYRKVGIGKALSLAHLDWLQNSNCDAVLGSSWVNGTENNSQHIFVKAGFKILGESTEFLKNQMKAGDECSVCMTSDCKCKSILFGIEVKELVNQMKKLIK